MTFSTDHFRDTVGKFVTGVTVVTTRDERGRLRGFTANAFTSVSLDPPLVLVCVGRENDTYSAMISPERKSFAVNILSADQVELANAFARKGLDEKFEGVQYRGEGGEAPVLAGVLAYLQCEAVEYFEGGDHTIVLGEVKSLGESGEKREPLLFYDGSYGALQSSGSIR